MAKYVGSPRRIRNFQFSLIAIAYFIHRLPCYIHAIEKIQIYLQVARNLHTVKFAVARKHTHTHMSSLKGQSYRWHKIHCSRKKSSLPQLQPRVIRLISLQLCISEFLVLAQCARVCVKCVCVRACLWLSVSLCSNGLYKFKLKCDWSEKFAHVSAI